MAKITNKELIQKAKSVVNPRKSAKGKLIADVGAALVTDKGSIYFGVCFDTQGGSGICAERSAIASMITGGESKVKKIVAVWTDGTIIAPCGICREWLWQIDKSNWDTKVIVGEYKAVALKYLLPFHWHNPNNYKKAKVSLK